MKESKRSDSEAFSLAKYKVARNGVNWEEQLQLMHCLKNDLQSCARTTILNAVKNTVHPPTQVVYQDNPDVNFVKSNHFCYAIVVVGEIPYAEMFGDSANLTIADPGTSIISNVCGVVKCVVVVISGRPVVMEPYLANIDALVAAWLPGIEGQGVADVLFGDYGFTGKLKRTWFKSVDKLRMNVGDPHYYPLFPFGFGLTIEPLELKFTNRPGALTPSLSQHPSQLPINGSYPISYTPPGDDPLNFTSIKKNSKTRKKIIHQKNGFI
ncbi:uncharacterized protein LOC129900172 [Solanum dulcamara]|uniref:uncharacterized protein LOC129900172 n=1 Tax=Solanum dulcamara TaxID=45834 RepID=UPI0024864EAC|nr:uncharacterized protein LOC129900172 [Solanum dulcamara]